MNTVTRRDLVANKKVVYGTTFEAGDGALFIFRAIRMQRRPFQRYVPPL